MEKLGRHPNVVNFFGVVTHGTKMMIVTQYASLGSLYELVIKNKAHKYSFLTILGLVKDAAMGILHLHYEQVIHRDIAARNVLVEGTGDTIRGMISDFGMSRVRVRVIESAETTQSSLGPVGWMAPESIRYKMYSEKSDVWMFGVLLWEVIAQETPWNGYQLIDVAVGVAKEGWHLEPPKGCDPVLAKIMDASWKQDPAERPDFIQIKTILETYYNKLKENEKK